MSIIDCSLSWNNVTLNKIIILMLLVVAGICYIFNILTHPIIKPLNNWSDNTCVISCDHDLCQSLTSNFRDGNYLLGSTIQPSKCIFTMWELWHLMFHVFLGYYYNIYISITMSVIFELFEHYIHNCASILDLFWNFLGLVIGVFLRCYTYST